MGRLDDIFLVFATAFLYWLHKAFVDIKMWDNVDDRTVVHLSPDWMRGDWTYLGGMVLVWGLQIAVALGTHLTIPEFVRWTAVGTLFGSEAWDCIFSFTLEGDAFYPLPNWFAGWGFKTKMERLRFDSIRIGIALSLIFL